MQPIKISPIKQTSRLKLNLIILLISTVFIFSGTGCKKDPALNQNEDELNGKLNFGKADIVVHKNGSIQAAVNAAKPGALIHIEPGTYTEAVTITKPGIKLVGLSNSKGEGVILQNPGGVETGIMVLNTGKLFALQNITLQNFDENGIKLDSVDGFYLSHVYAVNNGGYGIYPVFSSHGIIEHCTANGSDDTGIYVGQSSDVAIRFCKVFDNVNGIEAENATNISITFNECYNNTLGIFADLLPGKKITTATNVFISHNIVRDNNHANFSDPTDLAAVVPSGLGILILGTDNATVEKNTVTGNNFSGIVVFSTLVLGILANVPPEAFADIEPNPDGAKVRNNQLSNNGTNPPVLPIPLPGVDLLWDGSGNNNCWSNNVFQSSYPSPLPACN